MPSPRAIRRAAKEMLSELESNRLVVMKYRTNHESEETWRRSAIAQNPDWYRWLCRQEMRSRRRYRKPRTIIKRCDTLYALKKIASGKADPGRLYVARLMPLVVERAESLTQGVPF